jgi:hypothetical protein
MLIYYLIYFSSLKMEAICHSEISVRFQLATRRHIIILHKNRSESVRRYKTLVCISAHLCDVSYTDGDERSTLRSKNSY